MKELIYKRIANLLSIKSLVTLILTFVVVYLSCTDSLTPEISQLYGVIIAFYFGTQATKSHD